MNEILNIQELADLLAEKHGMNPKNADRFVREFFLLVEEALENDKYVKIKGLGVFKLIDIESPESVRVTTGEKFEIKGHAKVFFTPESVLKEIINKPFSHFETVVLNGNTVLEDTLLEEEKEDGKSEDAKEEIKESEENPVIVKGTFDQERSQPVKKETAIPSAMKFFIGILIFVVVLCLGAVIFMYYLDLWAMTPSKPRVEENTELIVGKHANGRTWADGLATKDIVEPANTAAWSEALPVPAEKQDFPKKSVVQPVSEKVWEKTDEPVVADSVSYTIIGTEATYIIKEGETLAKVALYFYGTKALWPYITKHNPVVIKNPNNVLSGSTIKIPKLAKK